MTAEKVREDRLRRAAKRQGLRLIKSRTRDPRALDYGGYWLMDDAQQRAYGPIPSGMTLDEVERFLDLPSTEQGRAGVAQAAQRAKGGT
jgi:hypothetical protein